MGFSLPFFKKKSQKSVFFGLYITDASAFGFVFELANGQPYIISQNTYNLTAGFDKILEDIDNLISELELKTNLHLNQTIFFLHSWMIDEESYEIKAPYKDIIKQLSKDLELEPLGYIDVKEALEQYFKDHSIVNTVAIEVNKTKLGVSVIKGNKIIHSQYIARTDEVGDDLNSVFKELPKHVILPSTIKVFGDEDKAEVSSKLSTYEWDEQIFPQHPIIEVIQQAELNQALVATFAKEMTSEGTVQEEGVKSSAPTAVISSKTDPLARFGFVENKDIRSEPKINQGVAAPELNAYVPEQPVLPNASTAVPSILGKLRNSFSTSGSSNTRGKNKKKILIVTILVIVSVISLLFVYEYFLHTLHIKIYLKSKTVDQTFDIDIPIKETDSDKLSVVKKSVAHEYSNNKQTTGSREVGEKATGTVTIKNFDNKDRTFIKGTKLSKGDWVFLLDKDVQIPAGETTIVNDEKTTAAGKISVTVTAENIGQEYNIAKNTEFSIEELSNLLFVAIAEDAFTGGSKKEVTTISKKDMDTLEAEAEKQAENNTENVLGEQISSDEIVISDLTKALVKNTNFSGEVGEEAPTLSIKAESEIEYYTIQKPQLLGKLQELFSKEVQNEYKVDPDDIEYKIEDIDRNTDDVLLTISASATTHKDVDLKKLTTTSQFKLIGALEDQLKKEYEIEKIEIDQPLGWLPVLSSWTPFFSKNISVSTSVR